MRNTIEAVTEAVRGRVITPLDPDYDDAHVVYNTHHNRKSAASIQCVDSAGVEEHGFYPSNGNFDRSSGRVAGTRSTLDRHGCSFAGGSEK